MNKETRYYLLFLWDNLEDLVKESFHNSFDEFSCNYLDLNRYERISKR